MFGETTIFHVKIWNHPIETTILKWMFQVPGMSNIYLVGGWTNPFEKYARQNGFIFPKDRDENKKYLSCHHLDIDCSGVFKPIKTLDIQGFNTETEVNGVMTGPLKHTDQTSNSPGCVVKNH